MNAEQIELTEGAVLDEVLAFFAKPGSFTSEYYFSHRNGAVLSMPIPGEHVSAACAIGGIEQAIWRITGTNVSNSRHPLAYIPDENAPLGRRTDVGKVYGRVMGRLNRLTREMYGGKLVDDAGDAPENIEELTGCGSETVAKRRVLRVIRAAKAEIGS